MLDAKILVLDDNKSVLSALEILLQFEYKTVKTISNPNQISSFPALDTYDIVLLDTTPESLSRQLRRLSDSGVIVQHARRRITIADGRIMIVDREGFTRQINFTGTPDGVKVGVRIHAEGTVNADGVIEAIEAPAADYCIGVQWHPEADPAADNETEEGMAQNRRVAVNILVSKAVDGIQLGMNEQ